MASIQQMTGMRGVYLVSAELSRLGFIASPTSRSAIGADILATDQSCRNTFSVQVKTNARTFNFWLLTKKAKEQVSKNHIYILVNLRHNKTGDIIEYFIVPSIVVSDKMVYSKSTNSEWYAINLKDVETYRNDWSVFGTP